MSAPSILSADLTDRIAQLKIRAMSVVEGALTGSHRSRHRGQSVEFSQHKEYAPGDEIRHVDWKAYGKFDKYYVKQFEQESNLTTWMAIDASGSMGYRSGAFSKLEVAATLAAAFSYLLIRQQDAVGLLIARGDEVELVPARATPGHLPVLLEALARVQPSGPTHLRTVADRLAEQVPRRGLVFVFSDLFDLDPLGLPHLLQLRHLKVDLSLFQVLDPDELSFPFEDPTLFLSMEDQRQQEARPLEIRESYLDEMSLFLAGVQTACATSEVTYTQVRTEQPLDRVVRDFVQLRGRGASRRRA
jgi:uncharacterized protein (DUF58 family)